MANREIANVRFKNRAYTKSIYFDGVDDLATVPLVPATTGFSMGFWIKLPVNVDDSCIFDYRTGTSTNGGFRIFYALSRYGIFSQAWNTTNLVTTNIGSPTGGMGIGRWVYVTLTYVVNSYKLYIDGVLVATDTSCEMTTPAGQTLTIGRRSFNAAQFGKFWISELCFQNTTTAWTQAQIDDLYYRAIPPTGSTFYSLNDTALDQNGENGLTVTGATYVTDVPHGPRTSVTNRQLVRDFGTCLQFAGNTDRVAIADSDSLDLTGNYSISFWMYPRSLGGGSLGRILDKISAYTIRQDSSVPTGLVVSNGNAATNSNNDLYSYRKWNFIVVTYDGANARYYGNSSLNREIAQTTNPTSNSGSLYIGNAEAGSFGRGFNGYIDDVRIYKDRVLGLTEISNLYRGVDIGATGLVGHWKLDEGSGTSATDSSGNSNTGTITGSTYSTNVFMKPRSAV